MQECGSFSLPNKAAANLRLQEFEKFSHTLSRACLERACPDSNPAIYGEAAAGSGSSGQEAATWVRQHQQLTHLVLGWRGHEGVSSAYVGR